MPHDSTFFMDLGLSWTKPTSKVATSAILIPSSAMVATDWSHQLRCKHCGKVVARSVLDDMKAQITLGVRCISQAVYMLRTKMYWFKTTPNDVNTYIYIGQQLKCRRTCPIGWRGHVFRWHVHTFWLPKLWNRQIQGWNLLRFSGFNSRIRFCTWSSRKCNVLSSSLLGNCWTLHRTCSVILCLNIALDCAGSLA